MSELKLHPILAEEFCEAACGATVYWMAWSLAAPVSQVRFQHCPKSGWLLEWRDEAQLLSASNPQSV